MFKENKSDRLFLGVPLLISLLIKLVLLFILYDTPINKDGTLYIGAAEQFAMGNFADGFAMFPMPAYSLLIAFVHMIIPDWILTGYLISTVSMILVTIPLYYLIKAMFGAEEGFWACLIFAILPRFNEWSMNISRDPLFLVLFSICILVAFKSIAEKNSLLFGLTFILSWFTLLIRIESIVFIGFYFFVLVCLSLFQKDNRLYYFLRALIWIGIPLSTGVFFLLLQGLDSIAVNRLDYIFFEIKNFFNGSFLSKPFEIYAFFSEAVTHPPFHDGHYSFAAICKHYLPLIYVLAILQILIKIIFPLSIIPLYFGIKDSKQTYRYSGKFIFCILIIFIMLGYYYLIKNDDLPTRYLMIPAFLLLPWVGLGLKRLHEKLDTSSYKKIVLLLIVIVILAPAVKTLKLTTKGDFTNSDVIEWLQINNKIGGSQIVTNDYRLAFSIDLEMKENTGLKTYYYNKNEHAESIEDFSFNKDADFIAIKKKNRNVDKTGALQSFQKVDSFVGKKYTVYLYAKKR